MIDIDKYELPCSAPSDIDGTLPSRTELLERHLIFSPEQCTSSTVLPMLSALIASVKALLLVPS